MTPRSQILGSSTMTLPSMILRRYALENADRPLSLFNTGNGQRKRILLPSILLSLLLLPSSAGACDFCNCVMGINPFYTNMNRIGLTTLLQRSHRDGGEVLGMHGSKHNLSSNPFEKLLHGGAVIDSAGVILPETEQRLTLELSYRHHLSQNVIVTALLPFTMSRVESVGTFSVRGFGDATLLGHYVFGDLFSDRTPSTLLVGAGVELPTGSNNMRDDYSDLIDPRFQPGSGSVDVVGNVLLTVPVDKWVLGFDGYGKLNNSNGRGDRIGNSLALTGTASHELYRNNPANVALIGVAGVRAEFTGKDYVADSPDFTSGSSVLWGNVGTQLVIGSLKMNVTGLIPFAQHREVGGSNEHVRFSAGVGYEFN